MRILWLSPFLRATARIRAEDLRALGAEVMLITADLHYESDQAREYETVLIGRPVLWADWLPFFRAYREARRFKPDVVVTELLRDPRWRMFARLAPRARLVHDDRPHDETHVNQWWNRILFDRWDERADATVVFSHYVGKGLTAQGIDASRIYVTPLASDLERSLVPDFVAPEDRSNFVMFGRQSPYKNHAVVFAAWDAHVRGRAWRGDDLVIIGGGEISQPLPPHARWRRGSFKYREVVGQVAKAKGSIVHYTSGASQSGVHVLSMQLGVPTLVSAAGALPEYQPPGLSITGIDDVDGLAAAFDELADPAEVARQSRIVLEHYQANYDSRLFAKRLLEVFDDLLNKPHRVSRI